MEKIKKFKTGQSVWWWNGDNYQNSLVEDWDEEQKMYWLSMEDFFPHKVLFKTKKECAHDTFPII